MVSDFEKSLARFAAERNTLDAAREQQEREHAEKAKLAHSIIDPYLAELGPQVVRTLRDLDISPIDIDKYGIWKFRPEYWNFEYYREYDEPSESFVLSAVGMFGDSFTGDQMNPFGVGFVSGNRISWREHTHYSTFLANLDDKKTYLQRSGSRVSVNQNNVFQEVSDFIAEYIYRVLKK